MDAQTTTNIIIGCVGALLLILISITGYFIVKRFDKADRSFDKIGELAVAIEKLGGIIQGVESQMVARQGATDAMLKEHHEAIEISRRRSHWNVNKVGVLKYRAETTSKVINDIIDLVNALKENDQTKIAKIGNIKSIRTDFSDQDWDPDKIVILQNSRES